MPNRSALILGATGAVGRHLLIELLASSEYSQVTELGRKVTTFQEGHQILGREKLKQKVIDFEKIDQEGLSEGSYDAVYITLGTTRKAAGSAANFEKIDREYVINAAKAAKSGDTSKQQRLLYLSSGGSSASSPFLYTRSKGLTEQGLANLKYSDTIIFRPGLLTQRGEARFAEKAFGIFTRIVSTFGNDYEIPVQQLAKAMVRAGEVGSEGLPKDIALPTTVEVKEGGKFTAIGNRGSSALGDWTK